MLTLMLLRHAKAVQHAAGGDIARPLAPRGIEEATALGRHLGSIGLVPDYALVSPSVRTRHTFSIVDAGLDRSIQWREDEALYNADAAVLRDCLKTAVVATLMIVGHNPGIMEVAIALARDGDVNELGRLRAKFPPCALAVLTFDTTDWLDARAAGGRLDLLLMPDDIIPSR